jgi:hypothetical protein
MRNRTEEHDDDRGIYCREIKHYGGRCGATKFLIECAKCGKVVCGNHARPHGVRCGFFTDVDPKNVRIAQLEARLAALEGNKKVPCRERWQKLYGEFDWGAGVEAAKVWAAKADPTDVEFFADHTDNTGAFSATCKHCRAVE